MRLTRKPGQSVELFRGSETVAVMPFFDTLEASQGAGWSFGKVL
jgi:hypothetical protein